MNNNIKSVYGVGTFGKIIKFIEPYSLTGSFKTLSGDKMWFRNGKFHREDGPAIECANGDKVWYISDKLHRENGPAIDYANGNRCWYINGKELTEIEFNAHIKLSCRDKIVEIEGIKYKPRTRNQ